MTKGSRQLGTSRALPSEGTSSHQRVPPTTFEPAPRAAADQQRLLEMEETIRMLVRRNQDMERQFRTEIERLKQQQSMPPSAERHASLPAAVQPIAPTLQDDQASSSSIPNRRRGAVTQPASTVRPPVPELNQQRRSSRPSSAHNDIHPAPAAGPQAEFSQQPAASQRSLATRDIEAIVARRLAELIPSNPTVPASNPTAPTLTNSPATAPIPTPTRSPFTDAIQAEVLPVGTNPPKFEAYNGSTDPVDHLVQFENTMILHNFSDAMYCKVFATTLKSTARTWFHQLPSSSIGSFAQLSEKFKNHFLASRPPEKDASYLMTLKQ